ncbi:DUF3035 domain-containing protein [Aliishimia ponticola]|uniref:DUF3035 domain-containing protein n=1 Tax=Aliishimia ponticola TaxID=2499833 RepID=A0A4S4NF50_9RHOB|nr:DUF3035 domain-containing protein [Aliishimia ponticola]THH36751.1 DUF3035 domain-containing protein [Aliishimia ponticola]
MRLFQIGLILVAMTLVSACENKSLRELARPSDGPDEFKITPGKPLQAPEDLSSLPEPTPGGANRTDQYPLQDSAIALGGRRAADTGVIPGADGAVVNYASRFGREAAIRQELAVADEDFRRRRGRFTQIRIVREDIYNNVYRRQALDAKAEQRRWRRAGAKTPSAPPE